MHAHTHTQTQAPLPQWHYYYSKLSGILERSQGKFFRSLEKDETNYLLVLLSSCLTLAKFHTVSSFRSKHLHKSTPDVVQWFLLLQNSQDIDLARNISSYTPLHFINVTSLVSWAAIKYTLDPILRFLLFITIPHPLLCDIIGIC